MSVERHDVSGATTTHVVVPPTISSSTNRFDERSLVESARHDADAFAELYRIFVDRIYAYSFRRSGSRAVAEDVTSATFEKALRGLATFRWKEPGIAPWLFRIASNELVDYYRRDSKQTKVVQSLQAAPQLGAAPTDGFGDGGDDALIKALAQIRPRYQRALTLRYFADLTNEEAALAMGVSRATMAVIVHRGAAALRKVLEDNRPKEVLTND